MVTEGQFTSKVRMSYNGDYSLVNNVVGETVFTEGGHYSPVNNVLGGKYSPVNNVLGGYYSLVNDVQGDILWGDTVHYDTGT